MDNLRGLQGIRRRGRVLNEWRRELSGVTKRVDEIIGGLVKWREWRMIGC